MLGEKTWDAPVARIPYAGPPPHPAIQRVFYRLEGIRNLGVEWRGGGSCIFCRGGEGIVEIYIVVSTGGGQ